MNGTRTCIDSEIRKVSRSRNLLAAGLIAGLVAVTSGLPAAAGSSADPDITDVAGDGNFINGQGVQPGHEVGPDTQPASFGNVDLRAVWFETAYSTTKVRDAAGNILRVEHAPTALVIQVKTQAPARPMSPFGTINYRVSTTLPGCKASFELDVFTTPPDRAVIRPLEGTQCDPLNGSATSSVVPTFEGATSTMTFPLADARIAPYISTGTTIRQSEAGSYGRLPNGPALLADETLTGRDFTIGQDVPPDIDCSADPANSECHS
jgi:hypothetical protein